MHCRFLLAPSVRTFRILLLLALVTAVVAAPRFNRADWLVGPLTGPGLDSSVHPVDARSYVATVRWIRGKIGIWEGIGQPGEPGLRAPFSYRLVVPGLAATLPLSPMTAINTVNLLLVIATMLLLYRLQRRLSIDEHDALLGCALFTLSFPTFYYSTIGYVDPILVFTIAACLNWIYGRNYLAASLAIGFGLLAKEGIVMMVPVLAVAVWQTTGSWKAAAGWAILAAGIWTALWFAVRVWLPVPRDFAWHISLAMLEFNLFRGRSWLTMALCVATVLAPLVRMRDRPSKLRLRAMDPRWLPMWTGLMMSSGYYGYSWLVAHTDGRMFWPIYCFAIPIAVYLTAHGEGRRLPSVDANSADTSVAERI